MRLSLQNRVHVYNTYACVTTIIITVFFIVTTTSRLSIIKYIICSYADKFPNKQACNHILKIPPRSVTTAVNIAHYGGCLHEAEGARESC